MTLSEYELADQPVPATYRVVDSLGTVLDTGQFINLIEAIYWAIRTWRAAGVDEVSLLTEGTHRQIVHRLAIGEFTATNIV